MYVVLIQPPVALANEVQVAPREPPVPPWDLICLHSYLLNRTRHQSIFFDARVHPAWRDALELQLPYDCQQVVFVVRARAFEWPAALRVLQAVAERAPQAMRVLCGPLATACPEACARRPEVDAVIAGDPELTLRTLLENRHSTSRLRTVPGLALNGGTTTPVWTSDLTHLPAPAWERLPWREYTTFAQGGLRALMRLSRGHPGQPADRAVGGVTEPLRLFELDRMATSFGKAAHLGVVETLVVDPPGLWTSDRLRAWCQALCDMRNTHPWSLQLLPHILSEEECALMLDAGCRRVELIIPSPRPAELSRYGVHAELRTLHTAVRSMALSGLEVLLRGWVGGPGEGRTERADWLRLLGRLDYPPVRFQPFPLAFDAPIMHEPEHAHHVSDLASWVAQVDATEEPVMAWEGSSGQQRAQLLCADLERVVRDGWRSRWRRFRVQWRDTSVIEQLELRATSLLKPAHVPAPTERPPLQRG